MNKTKKIPLISIIVPFYNENESVNVFFESIFSNLNLNNNKVFRYELICIDDGSVDNTFELLMKHSNIRKNIKVIQLSRNFGKEAALSAGLDFCNGDAAIPVDADLQDPLNLILDMVKIWIKKDFNIINAIRINRENDSFVKRFTSFLYYKIHNYLCYPKIPVNVGDFRLIDRQVIDVIKQLPENQRFMKGIFSWAGFSSCDIEYVRPKRVSGKTKFSNLKLWNLALDGLTSFSTAPLRVWTYLGIFLSFASFLYAIFIILKTIIYGVDISGYASIIVFILFISGIQFISIGILGEYIGRIYHESKRRPLYVVKNKINFNKK